MVIPATNTATVTRDGPYHLRGKLVLGGRDDPRVDTRMALCRCGASQHKPFCDNSHRKAGFHEPGALPSAAPAPADAEPGAPLTITPGVNGPLKCVGPLTVRGSDGTTAYAEATFLCRCGGSANKPYCDGTHKRLGFTG